uniref:phosphoglycerate dehydrogenase n=1 Tax=Candidatus Enterococcus willemsii TaxID=1857215 RepID=UPI00403F6400
MTKYILSTRPFRNEFIRQAKEIAPYEFVTATEIPTNFDWQSVEITIGWSKDWQDKLLIPTSSLKWVQSISAGVDTLPLELFAKHNVYLSNTSGLHATSITEHLLAILLMKTRGILDAIKNQEEHCWAEVPTIQNLQDLRILIVGTGKIGQELAKSLTFFQTKPIGINTNGRKIEHFAETYALVDLAYQAQKADVIINILPLTEDTYHLYDHDFFKTMKTTATFINVGRGPSVDTTALYQALNNRQIGFAALDVFEEEPLPSEHPLWKLDNLLITPHFSGFTPHFQKAFMQIFLENLASFTTKGSLIKNVVNIRSGY